MNRQVSRADLALEAESLQSVLNLVLGCLGSRLLRGELLKFNEPTVHTQKVLAAWLQYRRSHPDTPVDVFPVTSLGVAVLEAVVCV